MQINRTRADRAATRQRHACFAKARHQRAQHENRGAHGFDQIIGREQGADFVGMQGDCFLIARRGDTHLPEQLQHGVDIVQARHIGQHQRIGAEQGGRQYRQSRIFCAGNAYFTV